MNSSVSPLRTHMPRLFFLEAESEQRANLDVSLAMLSRAEIYQNNAAECEREGDLATIPALKNKYRGVAQQWREMAEQAKRSTVKRTKKRGSWAARVS